MRVTLIRTLVTAMGVIVLVTTGCERENDSWPPVSSQLHQEFSQKQDGLEVLADELADVLFIVCCLANQTGVDLTRAIKNNLEKKTLRDKDRQRNNPKL